MKAVGIICEYNPFHNGHLHHLEKVKEMFPNWIIVLVLNGYFLERGEISLISKQDKTRLALEFGVDLVLELPVVFGTQSADIFAEKSIELLHYVGVSNLVFGSECNNVAYLMDIAKKQLNPSYSANVKTYLQQGVNYPTALAKACDISVCTPNDLLGISYAKAILKNKWDIQLHTIQRTNHYHDTSSVDSIISASNIRNRIAQNETINQFVPDIVIPTLHSVQTDLLWKLLKYRILTDPDLSQYVTVDEGIEFRLKKYVNQVNHFHEFLEKIKTKRYTYNKINRMMIHILLGFTKQDNQTLKFDYLRILGFSNNGQKYLNYIRNHITIPYKDTKSKIYQYERIAAYLYDEITNSNESLFEFIQTPIMKSEVSIFDK